MVRCSRRGSILLCMTIMLASLGMFLRIGLHHISLFHEIVIEREGYYRNYYMADLVLQYGIELTKKYFDDFYRLGKGERGEVIATFDLSFICKKVRTCLDEGEGLGWIGLNRRADFSVRHVDFDNTLHLSVSIVEIGIGSDDTKREVFRLHCLLVLVGGELLGDCGEKQFFIDGYTVCDVV